ncbi:MAG: 23S rRNA (guanosine(2251)-2'-O)-methyltransferase RlmB [Gammaproteobacteria bacterium]|nr:23S rRNA (guanosine(2251)-2'-O)-methyltransferase RlmB [Gammaproteobacteria bacterium]
MTQVRQIIYGIHAVQAALDGNSSLIELWVQDNRRDERTRRICDAAARKNITVHRATRATLEELAGSPKHQGVCARVAQFSSNAPVDVFSLLDAIEEPPLLLILDGIQDPHNLGACLRTANAAGVHAVIAPKDKAVGITPTVRKVASGGAEDTPFFAVTNLARCLRDLKERGVWLAGTAEDAGQVLYEADLKGPLGLVMGAEGKGLRRLTREQCDFLVCLPMSGRVESLNVSVAAGVCLYEALRQRRRAV